MTRVLLTLFACASLASSQEATLPEIERLRASHEQAVTKLRSEAAKILGPARKPISTAFGIY